MTHEEYLNYLANNRRIDRTELAKWLDEIRARPAICNCDDYEKCKGWALKFPEQFSSEEEWLEQTYPTN